MGQAATGAGRGERTSLFDMIKDIRILILRVSSFGAYFLVRCYDSIFTVIIDTAPASPISLQAKLAQISGKKRTP